MNTTFTEFEQYLQAQDKSPLTIKGYLSDVHLFARWFDETTGDPFTPQNVTTETLRTYQDHLHTIRRLKTNTINRRMAAVSAYLEWAVSSGQIDHNPARDLRALRQEPSPPRWLDRQEQDALLQAIERDLQVSKLRYPKRWLTRRRDATMVLLLLNTGLRVSECLALRLDDVQLSENKGSLIVRGGIGYQQRSVPLNRKARQALADWLAVRPDTSGNDCLFLTLERHSSLCPMYSRTVQRVITRYGEEAGVLDVTQHALRHTFAKNLVDAGVSLEKVAALMGLKNLNVACAYYCSFDEQDLADAVERLVDVPKQKIPPDATQADVIARVQTRLATGKDFPPELVRELLDVILGQKTED